MTKKTDIARYKVFNRYYQFIGYIRGSTRKEATTNARIHYKIGIVLLSK